MKPRSLNFILFFAVMLSGGCLGPNADSANYTAAGEFGLTIVNSTGYILKVESAKFVGQAGEAVSYKYATANTSENYVEKEALSPGDTVYIARIANSGWPMVINITAYDVGRRAVVRGWKLFERPIGVRLRPAWTVLDSDLNP